MYTSYYRNHFGTLNGCRIFDRFSEVIILMAPGLKRFHVGDRAFLGLHKDHDIPATVTKIWTSKLGTWVKFIRADHKKRWMNGKMTKLDMTVCEQDCSHYMFQCNKLRADVVIDAGIATIYPKDDESARVLDRNVAFTKDIVLYIGALGLVENDDQILLAK